MKRLKGPCDFGDLAVLLLSLITYVPWLIIAALIISMLIKRII